MNKLVQLLLLAFLTNLSVSAQLNLRLGKYESNLQNFRDTTSNALRIASFILSSQEFRDSLQRFKFPCTNLSKKVRGSCEDQFSGQRVYDSLTRFSDTTLNIKVKPFSVIEKVKNIVDQHDQIGTSSYGTFRVTTRSKFLKEAAKKQVASIEYARHLAHEYCHIRGFYHNQSKKYGTDVSYTVGSLVQKIIKRRLKTNEPIM